MLAVNDAQPTVLCINKRPGEQNNIPGAGRLSDLDCRNACSRRCRVWSRSPPAASLPQSPSAAGHSPRRALSRRPRLHGAPHALPGATAHCLRHCWPQVGGVPGHVGDKQPVIVCGSVPSAYALRAYPLSIRPSKKVGPEGPPYMLRPWRSAALGAFPFRACGVR